MPKVIDGVQIQGDYPTVAEANAIEAARFAKTRQGMGQTSGDLGAPSPSLTANSADVKNQPTFQVPSPTPSVSTLDETLAKVKGMFTPLGQDKIEAIKTQVSSEFAPKFDEQARINALRDTYFQAGRAQQGDLGFGASNLATTGMVSTAEEGARQMNRLRDLMAAEVAARTQAAQSQNYQQQKDYLSLANDLRNQQLSELKEFNAQARQARQDLQAESANKLEYLSQLTPDELAKQGDLSGIEQGLGLPSGYIKSLQETKRKALEAKNTEEFAKVFNQGAEKATSLQVGQSFSLKNPVTGEEITFTGNKPDEVQVVSNKSGVYLLNKTTKQVTRVAGIPVDGNGTTQSTGYDALRKQLDSSLGSDGFVNTDTYKKIRQQQKDKTTFDKNFSWMLNPMDKSAAALREKTPLFGKANIPDTLYQQLAVDVKGGAKKEDLYIAYPEVDPAFIDSTVDSISQ